MSHLCATDRCLVVEPSPSHWDYRRSRAWAVHRWAVNCPDSAPELQVGDWLRISTPHPRRVWNDPDCYPTHVLMVPNYHHNRGRYRDLKAGLHAIFRSCHPTSRRQPQKSHLAGGDWIAMFHLAWLATSSELLHECSLLPSPLP